MEENARKGIGEERGREVESWRREWIFCGTWLLETFCITVLSWASAHGRSQLKRQKLRVGGYTENELKWFNYPRTKAHHRCKVSSQGVLNRLASSLCPCFVETSPTVEKAVSCDKKTTGHVSSVYLPSDSLHRILAWWAVTLKTSKNHKTVKIGGWALAWDNTV